MKVLAKRSQSVKESAHLSEQRQMRKDGSDPFQSRRVKTRARPAAERSGFVGVGCGRKRMEKGVGEGREAPVRRCVLARVKNGGQTTVAIWKGAG